MHVLWDIRQLPKPIIVRELVGEVLVTQCGIVKIECEKMRLEKLCKLT